MKLTVLGGCSSASAEEWTEDISWKLEHFIGVSDITTECINLQSITEITELILGNYFLELVASQNFITNRMKNHVKIMIKLLKWTHVTNSDINFF